jgi:prepilin-type N-terminal cleavage/methylation domain-containing protein
MKYPFKKVSGFTLIEMIVSLGVFSVVVTITVGAILVLISTNQRLQAEQSVMTNLSFALDTMTREMRTGYNYYCAGRPNYAPVGIEAIFEGGRHESLGDLTKDCSTGRGGGENLQGVSFYEGGDSLTGTASAQRILYFFDATDIDPANWNIKRRVGNEEAQSIVSSGIVIKNAEFFVRGTSVGDEYQPTIVVYIEAQDKNDPTAKTYYLETTVTQRTLDI